MSETIVVVGANHAGTAAVNTILDNYKDKHVVVFDRSSVISFLGCGMALWIGGQISGPGGLFYASKEAFEQKGRHCAYGDGGDAYRLCRKARHRVHKGWCGHYPKL